MNISKFNIDRPILLLRTTYLWKCLYANIKWHFMFKFLCRKDFTMHLRSLTAASHCTVINRHTVTSAGLLFETLIQLSACIVTALSSFSLPSFSPPLSIHFLSLILQPVSSPLLSLSLPSLLLWGVPEQRQRCRGCMCVRVWELGQCAGMQ